MNCERVASTINTWLIDQLVKSKQKGFVVGVSGGVDSGLVSTLCARTGKLTIATELPIGEQSERSNLHLEWLHSKFDNVIPKTVNLTEPFHSFCADLEVAKVPMTDLAFANLQSRLRMCALYAISNTFNCLVCGTGNLCEDMGVMFFSKYGDGGVDISPIGDLYKSEVRELAAYLGVHLDIVNAVPADGLWTDGRSDESQLGCTYDELEWIMKNCNRAGGFIESMTPRQMEVLEIYTKRHNANMHKMCMPPICDIPKELK